MHKCKPRSVSVVWESGDGVRNEGGKEKKKKRHEVMGFVGIQTGFESVGRRSSLRKTWMPSDQEAHYR